MKTYQGIIVLLAAVLAFGCSKQEEQAKAPEPKAAEQTAEAPKPMEKMQQMAQQVEQSAAEMAQKTTETVEKAAEATTGAMEKAAEGSKEMAAEVGQQAQAVAEKVTEEAKALMGEGQSAAPAETAAVAGAAAGMAAAAKEQAGEAGKQVSQTVSQTTQTVTQQATETAEAAKQTVAKTVVASAAPPETIVLEAKNGNVTLSHKMHGEEFGCPACHGDAAPGKFAPDKDWAHKTCKGCHEDKGAGPTKCGDCHKK